MTRVGLALLAVVMVAAAVQAQEEEPDLSFLEYLGSWEGTDEEWLIVAGLEGELDEEDEASAEDEQKDEQENE